VAEPLSNLLILRSGYDGGPAGGAEHLVVSSLLVAQLHQPGRKFLVVSVSASHRRFPQGADICRSFRNPLMSIATATPTASAKPRLRVRRRSRPETAVSARTCGRQAWEQIRVKLMIGGLRFWSAGTARSSLVVL